MSRSVHNLPLDTVLEAQDNQMFCSKKYPMSMDRILQNVNEENVQVRSMGCPEGRKMYKAVKFMGFGDEYIYKTIFLAHRYKYIHYV